MAGCRIKQMCFTVSLLHILASTLTGGCPRTSPTVDLLNGTSFYLSITDGMPGIFTIEFFAYISMDPPYPRLVTEYYSAEKVEVEVIDLNKSIIAISDPSKMWYICRNWRGDIIGLKFYDIEYIYEECKWNVDSNTKIVTAKFPLRLMIDLPVHTMPIFRVTLRLKETVQIPPKYTDPICTEPRKKYLNIALEKFKRGQDTYAQLQHINEMIKSKMPKDHERIFSLAHEFIDNDIELEKFQWETDALKRIERRSYYEISGRTFTSNSDFIREMQELQLRANGNLILRDLQAIFTKSNSADISNTTKIGKMISFSEIFQKAGLLPEDKNIDHTFLLCSRYIIDILINISTIRNITPEIKRHAIKMTLEEDVLRGRDQQILKDLPCYMDYFIEIPRFVSETYYLKKANFSD